MGRIDLLFKTRVRLGVGATEETLPIGAVELDASLEESHAIANEVTQYPVETGVDITDHVRRQPDRLTIRGIVTDHPVGLLSGFGLYDRSIDAYDRMRKMVDEAQLISVVTTLRSYKNMVIESIEVPRRTDRGSAVEMSITLRQILFASTITVAETADLGTQNATEVAA